MSERPPKGPYILAAGIAALVVLGGAYITLFYVQDLARIAAFDPSEVWNLKDAFFAYSSISGVVISVLVAYIVYLLLSLRARSQSTAWHMTRELSVSGEFLRRLYDQAPIPYVMLDKEGSISRPNLAALRLFGQKHDVLIGKNVFKFQPEEDREEILQMREEYTRGLPIDRREMRIEREDGSIRWVLVSIFEMRNPASRKRSGLVTLFDITEQKDIERAKTQFVSLASHQLRTPLSAIKWYSEMLLNNDVGQLSEDQNKYVGKVYENNQIMIDLVNTLLNISRLEMGTLERETSPISLKEVVESILRELDPQVVSKSLNVEQDYGSTSPVVDSDPKLIRIIIHNVISNAIKYTQDNGTVKIRIESDGHRKKVVVSDNGVGIPAEQQEKIFSLMFRADNVRKLPAQGTGIGLYLVKQLVEELGGSIGFESELNKGTVFTVTI